MSPRFHRHLELVSVKSIVALVGIFNEVLLSLTYLIKLVLIASFCLATFTESLVLNPIFVDCKFNCDVFVGEVLANPANQILDIVNASLLLISPFKYVLFSVTEAFNLPSLPLNSFIIKDKSLTFRSLGISTK